MLVCTSRTLLCLGLRDRIARANDAVLCAYRLPCTPCALQQGHDLTLVQPVADGRGEHTRAPGSQRWYVNSVTRSVWFSVHAPCPLFLAQLREIDKAQNKPGAHYMSVRPRAAALMDHFEQPPKDQEGNLQAVVAALKLLCPSAKFTSFS